MSAISGSEVMVPDFPGTPKVRLTSRSNHLHITDRAPIISRTRFGYIHNTTSLQILIKSIYFLTKFPNPNQIFQYTLHHLISGDKLIQRKQLNKCK